MTSLHRSCPGLLCFGMLVLAANAQTADPPWKVEMAKRHQALIERNGPGTDAALRDQLLKMKDEDQAAPERGLIKMDAKDKERLQESANRRETDTRLTAELKHIVTFNGWPVIALVGYDASNAAMLVLTHSPDHAWQLSLLPQLEALADEGKIDGASLATVIDKELVSEGKLQRYGTQFKIVDGSMAMFGVEDPSGLDARRAQVFLPPMDWYREQMQEMFHMKVSGKIVSAAK